MFYVATYSKWPRAQEGTVMPFASHPALSTDLPSDEGNFVQLVGDALHSYRRDNPSLLIALLVADLVYQVTPSEHPQAGTYEGPEEFLEVFTCLAGPGGIRSARVVPGSPTATVTTVMAHVYAEGQIGDQPDFIRFEFNPEGKAVLIYHVHRSPAA